jgi:hypothetical protein
VQLIAHREGDSRFGCPGQVAGSKFILPGPANNSAPCPPRSPVPVRVRPPCVPFVFLVPLISHVSQVFLTSFSGFSQGLTFCTSRTSQFFSGFLTFFFFLVALPPRPRVSPHPRLPLSISHCPFSIPLLCVHCVPSWLPLTKAFTGFSPPFHRFFTAANILHPSYIQSFYRFSPIFFLASQASGHLAPIL